MTDTPFFQITPIGGLGKVGGNCTLVGTAQTGFIIDAGIEFPYEKSFGVDHLIPPFDSYDLPETLIITHGHEDHIGAIPYLLHRIPKLKVFAPPFAAKLIRDKLDFLKLSCKVTVYRPFEQITLGTYNLTPIPLPHSIPDTYGLMIKLEDLCCFFASDFKLDETEFTSKSLNHISEVSSQYNQRLLLADSTNIHEESSPTNSEVKINLEDAISSSPARILLTCFSSNIERISVISEIAKVQKKKVIPYGRSMRNYIDSACELGLLDPKDFKEAESTDISSPQSIILISGCQADFTSTFKRVASGDDPMISLQDSDTFIYSAKAIPGNESQIAHAFDLLSTHGVKIISSKKKPVHSSGHPAQDQLRRLYQSFKPTQIIPIHGSHHHLASHRLFVASAFPSAKCFLLKNGDSFISNKIKPAESIKPYFMQAGLPINPPVIKQRRKIASSGMVILSIRIDSFRARKLKFEFSFIGIPEFLPEVCESLDDFLVQFFRTSKIKNLDTTKAELTAKLRTFIKAHIRIRANIIIHFI